MKDQQNIKRTLALAIFLNRKVIISCLIAVLVVGIAVAMYLPPKYKGTCLLVMKAQEVGAEAYLPGVRATAKAGFIDKKQLLNEVETLKSADVLKKTAEILESRGWSKDFYPASADNASKIKILRSGLTVENIRDSYLIKVTYIADSYKKTVNFLDALLKAYFSKREEVWSAKPTIAIFRSKAESTREKYLEVLNQLEKLPTTSLLKSNAEQEEKIKELKNLNLKMFDIERNIEVMKAKLAELNRSPGPAVFSINPPDVQNDPLVRDFRKKYVLMQKELADMLEMFMPNSQAIKRKVTAINDLSKEYAKRLKGILNSQINILKAEYAACEKIKKNLLDSFQDNKRVEKKVAILQAEADALRTSYKDYLEQIRSLEIKDGMTRSGTVSIGIIQHPSAPKSPVFPKYKRLLPILFAVGLIFGLVTAIFLELNRETYVAPDELEEDFKTPVAAEIEKK